MNRARIQSDRFAHALQRCVMALALWTVCLASGTALAQAANPREELERAYVAAFRSDDFAAAERHARAWVRLRPDDFIPHYNLAAALAQLSATTIDDDAKAAAILNDAAGELDRAVELGMTSKYQLVADGSLKPLRKHPTYRALLETWPSQLERAIDARLERSRAAFPKSYTFEKNAEWRMAFASGFAARAFETAKADMASVLAWWQREVLPADGVFVVTDGPSPDPWVMVSLPSRKDYLAFSARQFGARSKYIPGVYDNQRKELVAQDLGATLRHEFCHVLHYRDSDRRGQIHAVWIQEGLCSLVEDVEVVKGEVDGPAILKPVASWRTNSVKRLARGGKPIALSKLVTFDLATFTRDGTALPSYALARTVFLYLQDRGKLRAFYANYVSGWKADATGAAALEATLGRTLSEIDKDLIGWLKTIADVPDEVRPGPTRLAITVGATAGDGLTIEEVERTPRGDRASPTGDLRAGDTLLSVAGSPVHDANALARLLGTLKAGTEVEIIYRRYKEERTTMAVVLSR